ncbi:MAG: CopY/TcrY family copper transport repressor [Tetragenococcus sp.]|nr:CopY/TcrY family copper transport repressor [Tetragenococcus sp.]
MQVTNAEWQVMKIAWTKEVVTSKETVQSLQDKFAWTSSTVKTLLGRLVDKNCLATKKVGNKYYYSPILTEDESIHETAREVSEKTCAMKMGEVVNDLLLKNDFTNDDLDKIEAMINEKRPYAVDHVKCTCV